jgi:hypothetical protein
MTMLTPTARQLPFAQFGTNSGLPSIATMVMTVLNKDHLDWK